jgi:hypothetical protein
MTAKKTKINTVDSLRAERDALRTELTALDRMPLGATDVAEAAERSLNSMADKFAVRIDLALSRIASGHRATEAIELMLGSHNGQQVDAVAFVGLLGAAHVRDALLARLDGKLITGPSAAERAARRVEIELRLAQIEAAEERLIVAADEAGVSIPRRADCDITVVLAYAGPDADVVVDDVPDPTPEAEIERQQTAAMRALARERAAVADQPVRSEYLARGRE